MEKIDGKAEVKTTDKLACTVAEAAELLGLSTSAVYWMCYRKEIPHRRTKARGKKGQGKILIPIEELKKWLRGEDVRFKVDAPIKPLKKVK